MVGKLVGKPVWDWAMKGKEKYFWEIVVMEQSYNGFSPQLCTLGYLRKFSSWTCYCCLQQLVPLRYHAEANAIPFWKKGILSPDFKVILTFSGTRQNQPKMTKVLKKDAWVWENLKVDWLLGCDSSYIKSMVLAEKSWNPDNWKGNFGVDIPRRTETPYSQEYFRLDGVTHFSSC